MLCNNYRPVNLHSLAMIKNNWSFVNSFLAVTAAILFTTTIAGQKTSIVQKTTRLQKEFKDPPVSARPKALWPWTNGNFDLSQISFEMEEAKRNGMGGFDIWDIGASIDPNAVVPVGPPFLSDASAQAIAYAIREADRIGLDLGLTFSSSWNAGGSWVKPEHAAMGLYRSDTIVQGPQSFTENLPFPNLPTKYNNLATLDFKDPVTGLPKFYKDISVLAYPVTEDSVFARKLVISIKPSKSSPHAIDLPWGKWRIVRYVCAPSGQPLALPSPASKGPMLDHFSEAAQRANIGYVFKQLLKATGSLKNRSLKYLFADSYEVNSAIWTPMLAEEFKKRNSYSLEKYLPVLDGFTVDNKDISSRFLFDFKKTLSDLIIENHYRLGKTLCNEQGIGFVAEAGGPGPPIHNVPFEDLKALGALTIPRGEFWNKHPDLENLQIIKGISSAAHIYNQKYVEAESFTSVWLWQEGPNELKPLADRAMCEGLNRFVYHTFPHTPPESGNPGWVYNFGTLINTTNGWWPKSKPFHEYLARASYLLQQGNFVGDVAYYYGDRAPNFVPAKHIDASLGDGYDYDVVNSDVIINKMSVRNGRIYLPHGQFYEVLVLPDDQHINLLVLKKLKQLIAAGATVIGPRPAYSYGLNKVQENESEIRQITTQLWGDCDSVHVTEHRYGAGKIVWGKSIREVLLAKKVKPDVDGGGSAIDFIHRVTETNDIYFIRNKSHQSFKGKLSFRIKQRIPEHWNAETGDVVAIPFYERTADGIDIPISLDSIGAFFIVFPKGSSARTDLNSGKGATSINMPLVDFQSPALTTPITLNGPWVLHFDQYKTGIDRDTMSTLLPLNKSTKEAVKYASGTITYIINFEMQEGSLNPQQKILLDLGFVKEIAEVIINGQRAGIRWHAPYQIDITKLVREGNNELQVEVVTTMNNAIIGDAKAPKEFRKLKTNVAKLPNAWRTPFADAPLLDAGLIGPVQIKFAQVYK